MGRDAFPLGAGKAATIGDLTALDGAILFGAAAGYRLKRCITSETVFFFEEEGKSRTSRFFPFFEIELELVLKRVGRVTKAIGLLATGMRTVFAGGALCERGKRSRADLTVCRGRRRRRRNGKGR
jgi:hypothetical protein